jgi:predicted ATP-dependent endonuclease of OLD family
LEWFEIRLIEELEAHPQAQNAGYRISSKQDAIQLIPTTHSPISFKTKVGTPHYL